ncbi:class I SAM-dependent methyltransferase [Flexithrix dorotheae]|uniref:class I SAM-dependent methyltransferase n=1 Tax=Flexithrix dorotheae TaxID=70993 RepID=UPI00037DC271|nr:class I SAM-dependent methyltransferase [Flexithrix dorotheae]
MFSTTEITSHEDQSDNVIHQRLFYAYVKAAEIISGDVLEIGCGAGRGLQLLAEKCDNYTAIDKNKALLDLHQKAYPDFKFIHENIPPLSFLEDNSFDFVISFQVIEHIYDDNLFVREIQRVLKPGGKAIITTPNIKLSLTRNPWHVREYTATQLEELMGKHFGEVDLKGITGSEKVIDYYESNKESVRKITRFDIFNLQYRLPRQVLQVPYDILNRLNRKSLQKKNNQLVLDVTIEDYLVSDRADDCFDFFCIAKK